jgi:hypothetical protein
MNQKGEVPAQFFSNDGFVGWVTSIANSQDCYLALFNITDRFSTSLETLLHRSVRLDRNNPWTQIDLKLGSAKRLLLATTDSGDGIMFDHSVWVNPRFLMQDGTEMDATSFQAIHSTVGYGRASTSVDPEGNPLKLKGRPGAKLLSVHAPSRYVIEVPDGAVRFVAEGTLSDKALSETQGGSVGFEIHRLPRLAENVRGRTPPKTVIPGLETVYGKLQPIWPQEGDVIPWHGCQLYRYMSK